MYWNNFRDLKINSNQQSDLLPRYNLTNDMIGFRRCARQYGFFNIRGYIPSHTIQLFYGSIIHQVLDKIHYHYRGSESSSRKGEIPTDADVDTYFSQVENALRIRGIRPFNPQIRDKALRLIKKFNQIEGPNLYHRIVDTEHRLEGRREKYLLEGVVDVLVGPNSPNPETTSEETLEIWDYKGTKFPKDNQDDFNNYKYQMLVYSALYKIRNNVYPRKAVLYFLNELDSEKIISRPNNSILEINISDKEVDRALEEFDETANAIQKCKEIDKWDPPNVKHLPLIQDTCAICDIRWSCSSFIKMKNPPKVYP